MTNLESTVTGNNRIRTLLVDDSAVALRSLSTFLAAHAFIDIVGTASSGLKAISLAQSLRPDLILMDLKMPDLNGLQATGRIVQALPQVRIIMLTMHDNPEVRRACLQFGAASFVSKPNIVGELVPEIQKLFELSLAPKN